MHTANGHLLETEAEVDDWYNLSFKWWWLWTVGGLVVMITDAAFMMSIIMEINMALFSQSKCCLSWQHLSPV